MVDSYYLLAEIGLALLAACGLVLPWAFRGEELTVLDLTEERADDLRHHRERLLTDIRHEFETGKISEEEYQRSEAELLSEQE